MNTLFRTTAELGHPIAQVRAALLKRDVWPVLIPGAEVLGRHVQYRNELFSVRITESRDGITWEIAGAADPRMRLYLSVLLTDRVVTTDVAVRAELVLPTTLARLRRRATLESLLGVLVNNALRSLDALLTQSPATPLDRRYPNTVAAFRAMGALEHLQRIVGLDATWDAVRAAAASGTVAPLPPAVAAIYDTSPLVGPHATLDFDLIYAGGGLGLIHAAVMAQRYGHRVLVFDRGEVGCAHREWNISRSELRALVTIGLFSWADLHHVIMREYDTGVVHFHGGPDSAPAELWMRNVLDVALDANALLQLARRRLEEAGGVVLDHRHLVRVLASEADQPVCVQVEVAAPDGPTERYNARLLLDGMGSASPLALRRFGGAPFAGVCPTVGTVVRGLAEGNNTHLHNPQLGDILLTIDKAQRGQQYMWEGFPGRDDELTVYLFYYDTFRGPGVRDTSAAVRGIGQLPGTATPAPNLMQLFEDYFALLPTYKQPGADFQHLKPVYGYIPARHSLQRQEAPLLRGVLPVGDSAAQQSPLTFCGFGSHVRNLERTTSLLHAALDGHLTSPEALRPISAYQANASLNWVFSRFMQPWATPHDVNVLQGHFMGVLNGLGEDLARRFFRDEMRWSDYHRMVLGMFVRYPGVVNDAWQVLGAAGVARWVADYGRYSGAALLATVGRVAGARRQQSLLGTLSALAPARAQQVRAQIAEWRAMGWS